MSESQQWNDDRAGRFVILGLVMALAFLMVAAAIWLTSGDTGRTDALATKASAIAPPTEPMSATATSAPSESLELSSYPMPAEGQVMTAAAPALQPAPAGTVPPPAPATDPTSAPDTTTTVALTTTIAPTTTVPATTAAPTTAAPKIAPTTIAPSTTSTTTAPTTTSVPPTTTVPGPVVTSPASADATLLDVVQDTPDLSRVRELVEISGFAPELDAARALTFLAPSNAAVDAWRATPEGEAVLADPDAVYDLLLRHLVPEALDEETIFSRTSLDTVSGAHLTVRQQSHTIDGADLLVVNVSAANGYLHVASDVLT